MMDTRFAFLFAASIGLVACQGSVSIGESGTGGTGGGGGNTGTGTGTDVCAAPDSPEVFEIGTGESCFESLATDQEVPLMSGPQGGYHMWLAVGCEDCGAQVDLKFGVRDPATHAPLAGTYDEESMVALEGKDWPQIAGLIIYMPGLAWDPESQPPPAKGTKVLLWGEAYSPDGALLHSAEVEVLVGDPVDWSPCATNPDDPLCQTG